MAFGVLQLKVGDWVRCWNLAAQAAWCDTNRIKFKGG